MNLQSLVRKAHLYLGVFFTPILVFFVVSGWYQTMNPDRRKTPQDAEAVFDRMRFVHAESLLPSEKATGYSTKAFRWFVATASLALLLTTGLGLYLAIRHSRRQWPVVLCLVLGVALPLVILWLGQKR
jgi:p-aminobenzoyl-glutamate transporter AbgT